MEEGDGFEAKCRMIADNHKRGARGGTKEG